MPRGEKEELKQAVSKRRTKIFFKILQPQTANDTTPTAGGQKVLAKPLNQLNGRDPVMVSTLRRTPARLIRRLEGKQSACGAELLVVNGKTLLTARAEADAFTHYYTSVEWS